MFMLPIRLGGISMIITLNRKCFTQALVLAGTTALCLSLGAGSAFAQDDEVEEIIVTGSRIARDPNLGAPVAVQSVDAQQIQLSGNVELVEVDDGIVKVRLVGSCSSCSSSIMTLKMGIEKAVPGRCVFQDP